MSGVDADKALAQLSPQQRYHVNLLLDMEGDMKNVVQGVTRYPESQFRRQGLPILSGLVDGTFDETLWGTYIGSMFVGLEVVSDDLKEVLFTLPPLLYTGPTLRQVEGQPSLSEESQEISNHGQLITQVGEEAMASLIKGTLDGIDQMMAQENANRAVNTINTINAIFERYNVHGRVPMPEGLTGVLAKADKPVTNVQSVGKKKWGQDGLGDEL